MAVRAGLIALERDADNEGMQIHPPKRPLVLRGDPRPKIVHLCRYPASGVSRPLWLLGKGQVTQAAVLKEQSGGLAR